MTDTPTYVPLTESLAAHFRHVDDEGTVAHIAEGVDLIRGFAASGEREISIALTKMIAGDVESAALAIGILVQVALRADKMLSRGTEQFESLPEDVKEGLRNA